jgi:excisionase family DNA binding protein
VTNISDNSELLTIDEVAARMKVPTSWVYERTRRRGTEQIPHYKLGKYLRFDLTEVNAWLSTMQRG